MHAPHHAVTLAALLTAPLAAQPLYRATEIGPLGEPFQVVGGTRPVAGVENGGSVPAMWSFIQPSLMNAHGQVVGTARTSPQLPFGGPTFVHWMWDGERTRLIDVSAEIFQRQTPPNVLRSDVIRFLTDDGAVYGETTWTDTETGNTLGTDVWRWREGVARVLSPRDVYESLVDGVTLRSANLVAVSEGGVVVGGVARSPVMSGTGPGNYVVGATGNDGWVYRDGSTTVLPGLTGPSFEHYAGALTYRFTFVGGVDERGRVYGSTKFLNWVIVPFAQAAWVYDGGEYSVTPLPPGDDYLVTGDGVSQYCALPQVVFPGGGQVLRVFGQSYGYSLGRDIWMLAADGERCRLGLWGTDYEATTAHGTSRTSSVTASTRDGKVAGRTVIQPGLYSDSADAWYFDGATTRRVGLTSPEYQSTGTSGVFRSSTVRAISASGLVLGDSMVCQGGIAQGTRTYWLYDPFRGIYRVAPTDATWTLDARLTPGGAVLTYGAHGDAMPPGASTWMAHSVMWNIAGELIDLNEVLVSPIQGPDPFVLSEPPTAGVGAGHDGWPEFIVTTASTGYRDAFRTFVLERVSRCGAADVGVGGGRPGMDDRLDNNDFIAFIDLFFAGDARADLGQAAGLSGHDGLLDNNDFVAFIGAFFAACSR